LQKLLACPHQETDKVENALSNKYFTTTGLGAVMDP
jgi:hypothetical protein